MFIRNKKNKSGSTSINLVSKEGRLSVVLKTFGSSSDPVVIERLISNAEQEIIKLTKQPVINFHEQEEQQLLDLFISGIEDFRLMGPELIFGQIFDQIGFSRIKDPLFVNGK